MNCGFSERKYPFIWLGFPDLFRRSMNKGEKKKKGVKRKDLI